MRRSRAQAWISCNVSHVESRISAGDKNYCQHEHRRPKMQWNSLKMCRDPMLSHNYTVLKFRPLSRTTFCWKSVTGARVWLKDPVCQAVLCTWFDGYAMLDGVGS